LWEHVNISIIVDACKYTMKRLSFMDESWVRLSWR